MTPCVMSEEGTRERWMGNRMGRLTIACATILLPLIARATAAEQDGDVVDIDSRRELFVDRFLIDRLTDTRLKLHEPRLTPSAGSPRPSGHYTTVLKDGDLYRQYYRGDKNAGVHWRKDGWGVYHEGEVTLYAECRDGMNWTEPDLGLYEVKRYPKGNVVLADHFLVNHNFSPFVDERPDVPQDQRYKAVGGGRYPEANWGGWDTPTRREELREKHGPGGLKTLVSADGIHWELLRDEPVIPETWGSFDSQNVAFWSHSEECYVCYFRTIEKGLRSISRTTSENFVDWTEPVSMNANAPGEHLYTNGTHPYFRAPHIYIALPTRFQANRGSTTDVVFLSTRGGDRYDRTFMEALIRPGLDPAAWGNRSNYAAWHVLPTGPTEMSIFVLDDRRYTLRLDGFVSVRAPWAGGELLTKPLRFEGKELEINYSTSAGGAVRVEIQDADGKPIPGFALDDCTQIVGDQIERVVAWTGGSDVSRLAGQAVRLRFAMADADLYSLRFRP